MSIFYQLGRKAGAGSASVGQWITALTGSPEERVKSERLFGQLLFTRWKDRFPPSQATEASETVNRIATQLTDKLKRCPHPMEVYLTSNPEAFACTLPGGRIVLSERLLATTGSDDTIAFLVAHEIAHVVRGHVRKRLLKSVGGKAVRTALSVLQRHIAGRVATGAANKALQHLHDGFDSGVYPVDQELEADLFASMLCKAAGFHPDAGTLLLLSWQQSHNRQNPLPAWIADHPPIAQRLQGLQPSS